MCDLGSFAKTYTHCLSFKRQGEDTKGLFYRGPFRFFKISGPWGGGTCTPVPSYQCSKS